MEKFNLIGIFYIILRIAGPIVCGIKAKSLNRNIFGWVFFGFATPLIAMFWIQFMDEKKMKYNEI